MQAKDPKVISNSINFHIIIGKGCLTLLKTPSEEPGAAWLPPARSTVAEGFRLCHPGLVSGALHLHVNPFT